MSELEGKYKFKNSNSFIELEKNVDKNIYSVKDELGNYCTCIGKEEFKTMLEEGKLNKI